jgi:glycosyltransferase involved in cell wall biosynthesis
MEDKKRQKVFCFFKPVDRHRDEVLSLRHSKSLQEAGWKTVYVVNDSDPDEMVDGMLVTGYGKKSYTSYFKRIFITSFQVYKKLKEIDADVYQTWFIDQLLTCMLLKLHGKKVVFHFREEYPYTYFGVYGGNNPANKKPSLKKRIAFRFIWLFMQFTLRRCDYVFATGNDEAEILKEMGVKRYVIHGNFPFVNWDFKLSLEDYLKREDRIIYYGTIYGISCQEEMLKALEKFDNVKYLLAGSFRNNTPYKNKVMHMPKWKDVEFVNGFAIDELPGMLNRSTISNILRDFSQTHYHQGNIGVIKMFESMEAALPLICPDVPVYREIWNKYKFGILVEPTDVKQIEDAIRYLVEHKEEAYQMGQEGRRAVIEKFSWDVVGNEYAEIIGHL